ncbi:hypothetical protein TIFTF001_023040 [Ficus carica]|uniref:Glycosyltransferase n=1 Tax=Ficus carica TaxID=3494 RepID=A0AA88AJQ3_FICCA|nr:hypothetical protein TIFTF001_023040 [Ficus carica]
MNRPHLHIAMCPWFALGHLTPYLHLANKLARKGHKIAFFVPIKTQCKIEHYNRFPHLITFVPLTVPHIDGLPPGAETTSDVPHALIPLVATAMDRTEHECELHLRDLKPDIVFYDFAYWIPKLARRLGCKTVYYTIISPVTLAYRAGRKVDEQETVISEQAWLNPPHGFPDSSIKLHLHETRFFVRSSNSQSQFGSDRMSLYQRLHISTTECDAFAIKSCREIEGPFLEFIETQSGQPILLAGPVIPEPPVISTGLEPKWINFLSQFKAGSVVYCAFGSECILKKDQFQELLLGFELSGLPFLAALKPPQGAETIEEALPVGFVDRVGSRGVVQGGWIQQRLILEHPSVGCFVTHCGSGSVTEALVSKCQLVMIPYEGDQIFQARLIGSVLKAGIEVERGEEDGFFTRESVCKGIKTVMEEESEVGISIRANRTELRELLLSKDLESSYIDDFIEKLQALVG